MRYIEEREQTPVVGEYDVIVAGGGVAGVAAALAARRAGCSVLLIEKSLMLGGLATLGLINYFVPMCNGRGVPIIGGMCEELMRLAIRRGFDTLPDCWRDGGPAPDSRERYATRFSANIFALELSALLDDEGIELLYDALAVRPVMAQQRCEGVVVESKGGREFYGAGVVIDATGDADLLHRAGVPTVQGRNYFTYLGTAIDIEHCRCAAQSGRIQDALYGISGGHANLYGGGHPEGMPLIGGVDAHEITRYIIDNHRLLLAQLDEAQRAECDVVQLPGMPQFRTTRRLDGDYVLAPEDAYRHFDDSIGAICDFDRRDYLFEVPLRCIARRDWPNLITAGRSASAREYAWDVLRVIPPAIVTGQAAGQAAAHALEQHCGVADVDICRLQRALNDAGLMIHFDDALLPAGPDAGEHVASDHI